MSSRSDLEIIEHPNSVELLVKAETGHKKAMELIQAVYEQIDEKTEQGKEWIDQLQQVQVALESSYEATIQLKRIDDIQHTTILKFNRDIAGLIARVEHLECESKHKVTSVAKHAYHNGRSDEAARRVGFGRGFGR